MLQGGEKGGMLEKRTNKRRGCCLKEEFQIKNETANTQRQEGIISEVGTHL